MPKSKKERAFAEVFGKEPSRVKQVRRKHGKEKARKMKIAIALDKAREKGAKIPR